jgi:DNA-binding transcriptional MerR regulator
MCGIEENVLRHWDKIGLFIPAKRDENTKYRYYDPQQIVQVNFIKVLTGLGIPLKTIAKISENRTAETLIRLFDEQEAVLDDELYRLQKAYSTMRILRSLFREGVAVEKPGEITLQTLDNVRITLGPANEIPWEGLNFYDGFKRYCLFANEHRVNLDYPIGGYYESLKYYTEQPSAPTRFFSVDPHGKDVCPAGEYLVIHIQGYYGQMENAPQRLADYAREHV